LSYISSLFSLTENSFKGKKREIRELIRRQEGMFYF
jgi:hypothetical protein